MKYIALLRGINVGGNNKVPMSELKTCFEELGWRNVSTYINSGNVIFEADGKTDVELVEQGEAAIEKRFGFPVRMAVITVDELHESMKHAPEWWGDTPGEKHNALFIIAPATAAGVIKEVGEPKAEYEKIAHHGQVIFWTASFKAFSRTRWSKIVGTKAYKDVTIRNANTARKLVTLTSE